MKSAVFHGTNSSSQNGWFPYIKTELEKLGMEVYVPDLPQADNPNIKRYNEFLFKSGWDFSNNLLIGHSSGSVEIMGLLQDLPEDTNVDTAILVGTFRGDLGRDDLKGMDIDFDYEKIKSKADKFIVIHSDNDPYCPLDDAKWISNKLNAEFILLPGQQHFSSHIDPKYKKFPKLVEIVKKLISEK